MVNSVITEIRAHYEKHEHYEKTRELAEVGSHIEFTDPELLTSAFVPSASPLHFCFF